jgi:membrane protease YdiL (CAAX protease family)
VFETTAVPPRTAAFSLSTLALVLFGYFTLGLVSQTLSLSWGVWFGEVFVFLALPFIALRVTARSPVPLSSRLALFGFAVGVVNYLTWAIPLMALSEHLFPKSIVDLFDGAAIFKNQSPVEMVVLLTGICVAAPFCEEFFFRGVFQPGLNDALGPARGIFLTAFIFSAVHFDPVGFMARLELGIVFGVLAWRTGSVWPGIFAHAANNSVSAAAYFLTQGVAEPQVELPWYAWALAIGLGSASLYGLWQFRLKRVTPFEYSSQARVPLDRAIAPWAFAAVLSIAALFAFDARGVVLNVYDALHPTPHSDAFKEVRAKARAGEVPVGEYFEQRKGE